MQIHFDGSALDVRAGATFDAPDVLRLQQAVADLEQLSSVTIDFVAVRQCDDAALVRLAMLLASIPRGRVAVRGLTERQWRLLNHVGLGASAL